MENLKSGLPPNVQQKNRTSYPLGYSKVGQAQGVSSNGLFQQKQKNEEVKSYITELMAEIKSKKIADATEVLEFLTSIMRGEEQEYSNISLTIEDGVEIETSKKGRFTPKIEDRLNAAYELLKRYPLMLEDELQKARLKKAIADAKISEAKVRILTEGGDKVADRIDEFMDKLVEEVKEDEST